MKKRVWILVSVLCIVAFAGGVLAKTAIEKIEAELRPDFKVIIDGKAQGFENVNGEKVYPILYEGTTYLPLRAIGEIMGKVVYWYEDDKTIELKNPAEVTVTDADVIVADGPTGKPAKEESKKYISAEQAREIALEKAGLAEKAVVFEKAEREKEKGIVYFDIEFKTGGVAYEAHIDAETGAVLKWELDYEKDDKKVVEAKDLIGKEDAEKIALKDAGVLKDTKFKKVELDRDDGIFRYEVEFYHEGIEYEYEIDAKTGAILKKEADRD